MIKVKKGETRYPFSRGILARSMTPTGLPLDEIYRIVYAIRSKLEEQDIGEIESKKVRAMVREELHNRGYENVEKYYLVSRQIAHLEKPVIILIGGATGVGKSVISAELASRFGIERIIGTDGIREIMRYMIPGDLLPLLHESSFKLENTITNPFVKNKLIYGFGQQASLVCEGARAFIRRSSKEGLNSILNGVHLVPGHMKEIVDIKNMHLFHYVLHLSNKDEHIQRFRLRAKESKRDPERYIEELGDIRKIQDYLVEMAKKEDIMIIENEDMEATIKTIMEDITDSLEKEVIG